MVVDERRWCGGDEDGGCGLGWRWKTSRTDGDGMRVLRCKMDIPNMGAAVLERKEWSAEVEMEGSL